MHSLSISSQAAQDYVSALEYYISQDVRVAEQFDTALENAYRVIQKDPLVWALFDDQHRRYRLHTFPYVIYYRVGSQDIEVVAIAHSSRRTRYWRE